MTHPKAPPPKVVPIGPAREVTGGWSMTIFGKSTRQRTAIGFVETLANGTIAFIDKAGNETELTAKEAREIDRAFSLCAMAADRRVETLSGFNAVRASRSADGKAHVTYRGQTHPMRLRRGRSRRSRSCTACSGDRPVLWVAINPSDRLPYGPNPERDFAHVCNECVERLVAIPTKGLREVSK